MTTEHEIRRAQAVTRFVESEAERASKTVTIYPGKPLHDHHYVAEHIREQAEEIERLTLERDALQAEINRRDTGQKINKAPSLTKIRDAVADDAREGDE